MLAHFCLVDKSHGTLKMPKVDEKRGLWVGGEGGTREGGDIFQTGECIHVTSDMLC